MGGGRHAGAESRLAAHGNLGEVRLDEQGVAHHADVGAQADDLDGVDGLLVVALGEPPHEGNRAERGLVEHHGIARAADLLELGDELPARGVAHAVRNRQVATLLRFEVVRLMRVAREDDGALEVASACGNAFRRVSLSSDSISGAAYDMPIVKAK